MVHDRTQMTVRLEVLSRESFAHVLAVTSIPLAAFVGLATIAIPFAHAWSLDISAYLWLSGIVPGILGVVVAIAVEWRRQGSIGNAVVCLGMGRPHPRQLLTALIACTPVVLAYLFSFLQLGVPFVLVPAWPLWLLQFVISQSVTEQVIYQGLLYRRLRSGRSFLSAATLSAVVFSLMHLSRLAHGISPKVLFSLGMTLVFAAILAYPAAYLFEKGGNSIWGFALMHLVIDSVDLFTGFAAPGPGLYIFLAAVLVTVPLTFLLARAWLPVATSDLPRSWRSQ